MGMLKVAMICFLLFFASQVKAIEVKNGSFEEWEDGLPVGWTSSTKEVVVKSAEKYEGESSLLLKLSSEFRSVMVVQEEKISIAPEKTYELSYFYKKDEGCFLWVKIRNHDKDGNVTGESILFNYRQSSEIWGQKTISFCPDPGTDTISIIFLGDLPQGDRNIWIDKVSLKEVEKKTKKADTKELLGNPGFESYAEDDELGYNAISRNWRLSTIGPALVTIISDPEQVHSGKKCIRAEQEAEGQGVVFQIDAPVNFQKKYKFSVWAKGIGNLQLMAYQYGGSGGHAFVFTQVVGTFELTEDWKEYNGVYSPSSGEVAYVGAALHFEGEAYFDDASLREVE